MKQQILELIAEIENWNAGDRRSFHSNGEVPMDAATLEARDKTIKQLKALPLNGEMAVVVAEMENWNLGDWESFIDWDEVPFDGSFVFAARQAKINQLRGLAKKLKK